MKELEKGRYDDISLEDYHRQIKGYSKSSLDIIDKSYSHYLSAVLEPREATPAMAFGSAFHCKVLTPKLFDEEYAVAPSVDRRTKAGKLEWQDFVDSSDGKEIITIDQSDIIDKMSEKMFSHTKAAALLKDGDAEHTFIWEDPKTGLKCKCRPDYLRQDGICIDVKTTSDASWFKFQRSVVNFRYHVQGAFFLDGISSVLKTRIEHFILIAIETSPPYEIAIYRLDENAIDVGRVSYEKNLMTAKEYHDDPEKPCGYPMDIQDMFLPSWCE